MAVCPAKQLVMEFTLGMNPYRVILLTAAVSVLEFAVFVTLGTYTPLAGFSCQLRDGLVATVNLHRKPNRRLAARYIQAEAAAPRNPRLNRRV